MTPELTKEILAAALMTAQTPLRIEHLRDLFEPEQAPAGEVLRKLLAELREQYAEQPVNLVRSADGYRFQANPRLNPWLKRLYAKQPPRPSRAFMETLAIIAYKQPITRAEIEDVRGVAVSRGILKTLQNLDWIRVVGHRESPGRPALYVTTSAFLTHFGLTGLDQLPPMGVSEMEALLA